MNLIRRSLFYLLATKQTKLLHKQFDLLFKKAASLDFPKKDLAIAKEYFEYNEYDLALDHIATQFYQFDLKIDQEFYDLVKNISKIMRKPDAHYEYIYLQELITNSER